MVEWIQNPSRRGVTYIHAQDYERTEIFSSVELLRAGGQRGSEQYSKSETRIIVTIRALAAVLGLIAPSLPTSKDNPSLERKPRGIDRGYRSLVCSCAVDHL